MSDKTLYYGHTEEELYVILQGLRNKCIFFIARPGAGKGTQAKNLLDLFTEIGKKKFGESTFDPERHMFQHLSTGELFRKEADKGTEVGKKFDEYMQKGQIIPSDLTFSYLSSELGTDKYQQGLFLDGYPKDEECRGFILKTLPEKQITPYMAILFDVTRASVIERLCGRLHCPGCNHDFQKTMKPPAKEGICDNCGGALVHRADDNDAAIAKRQDVFESKTMPNVRFFDEQLHILVKIDASQAIDKVTEDTLRALLTHIRKEHDSNFFPRPPIEHDRSATFHGHIDAKNVTVLIDMINNIERADRDWQHKCYPLHGLQLGAQTKNAIYKEVYSCLPNFHAIKSDQHFEAFATSRHGAAGFNYDLLSSTLEEAFSHPNEGVMTELEEELFVANFKDNKPDGEVEEETNRMTADKCMKEFLWSKVRNGEDWKKKMLSHVPRWELHHAVNIDKKSDSETEPPISLDDIHAFCEANGFQIGGWFIFRKADKWAYRSNEFSDVATIEEAHAKLIEQARALTAWVLSQQKKEGSKFTDRHYSTGFSLERVWAIWKV